MEKIGSQGFGPAQKRKLCSVCKDIFDDQESFDRHLQNVSSGHRSKAYAISVKDTSVKRFIRCFKCTEVFEDKVELGEHVRFVHSNNVVISDVEGHLDEPILPTLDLPLRQFDNVLEVEHPDEPPKAKKPRKKDQVSGMNENDLFDDDEDEEAFAPNMMFDSSICVEDASTPGVLECDNEDDLANSMDETNEIITEVSNEIGPNDSVNAKKSASRSHRVCAVKTCRNPQELKYFAFPREEFLKNIWIHRCSRDDPLPKVPYICERHFRADAFLPDIVNRKGKPVTKRLNKKTAIPTEFLFKKFPSPQKNIQRQIPQETPIPKTYKYFKTCAVKGCNNKKPVSSHCFPSDAARKKRASCN